MFSKKKKRPEGRFFNSFLPGVREPALAAGRPKP